MVAQRKGRPQRGANWGMRLMALAGSVVAFVGFWQLAVRDPHPVAFGAGATPTPGDNYTIPTGNNPIALPTPPHSGTGISR